MQSAVVANASRRGHQGPIFEFTGLGISILDLEWVSEDSFASLSDSGIIRLWSIGKLDPDRTFFHVNTYIKFKFCFFLSHI